MFLLLLLEGKTVALSRRPCQTTLADWSRDHHHTSVAEFKQQRAEEVFSGKTFFFKWPKKGLQKETMTGDPKWKPFLRYYMFALCCFCFYHRSRTALREVLACCDSFRAIYYPYLSVYLSLIKSNNSFFKSAENID